MFGIVYVGSQVMFTATFAASIALVLAVVHCLDFPFEGSLRLLPTDFQATLQKVVADQGRPQCTQIRRKASNVHDEQQSEPVGGPGRRIAGDGSWHWA